jgi:hypothetical protein
MNDSPKQWKKRRKYLRSPIVRRLTASNEFETLGQTRAGTKGLVNYTIGAKQIISLWN